VYRQNIRFSTTPLPLFPLKINVMSGKCCRNWFQPAWLEKIPEKTGLPQHSNDQPRATYNRLNVGAI
jgi:hypothetical protein